MGSDIEQLDSNHDRARDFRGSQIPSGYGASIRFVDKGLDYSL